MSEKPQFSVKDFMEQRCGEIGIGDETFVNQRLVGAVH
jgi:hypothetical protein